jgi:hypothetical protein
MNIALNADDDMMAGAGDTNPAQTQKDPNDALAPFGSPIETG